jgi:hypothetical protein
MLSVLAKKKIQQTSDLDLIDSRVYNEYLECSVYSSLCLNFFHLHAPKPNLDKFSIYSNKFFHNFHFSESSFTCPELGASGLDISS